MPGSFLPYFSIICETKSLPLLAFYQFASYFNLKYIKSIIFYLLLPLHFILFSY